MDLKNTKATEHYFTESKFRQWVRAHGTAGVSAELKNTPGKPLTVGQKAGYRAELNVIKLLQSKSWILCFHGLKTLIAEIDLIFEKEDQVLLIEVKTLNDPWRSFQRIHKNQVSKLQNNFIFFSLKFKSTKFKAYIAWVDPQNKITFVEVC